VVLLVAKHDVVKGDLALGDHQLRSVGRVLDLGLSVDELKHVFHVDEGLLDLRGAGGECVGVCEGVRGK
jgi:hypothetical protein